MGSSPLQCQKMDLQKAEKKWTSNQRYPDPKSWVYLSWKKQPSIRINQETKCQTHIKVEYRVWMVNHLVLCWPLLNHWTHWATSFDMLLFSHSVVSLLWPPRLQHARLPYPSSSPGACSISRPLSPWCHPAIWSSVVPFSFCLQSFPVSGSFIMGQLSTSGGQSIRASASASVLPMNIRDWFPLGLTGLISL